MDISIKGVQKTSLIDYPKKVASVVFVGNCNFRCPFCHNPELVLGEVKEDIPPEEVIEFFEKKKKWIDGVCITGGEPTLHKGLPDFMKELKKRGFLVKLDTNGANPGMVKDIIEENLADFFAMDIKADKENYAKAAGVNVDMKKIEESIGMIMNSGVDYEFRTTAVPGLFDEKTAEGIGEWLKGAKKFCLQQFRGIDKTLDPKFQRVRSFRIPELEKFKNILGRTIEEVELRGV